MWRKNYKYDVWVLHGIALLGSARGLYLARHLSTLYNFFLMDIKNSEIAYGVVVHKYFYE